MTPRAVLGWRLLFAGLLGAILWLALTPHPPDPVDTGWDKLNHVLAFGALAVTGRFGFVGDAAGPARLLGLVAALVGVGVAIEALQSLLPPRSAEVLDIAADALGIVAGLACAHAGVAVRRRLGPRPVPARPSAGADR